MRNKRCVAPRLESSPPIRLLGLAFTLVLLTAMSGTGAAAAGIQAGQQSDSSSQTHSFEGVVTDTRCGAKHSASIGDTAGDCTIRCIRAGERFALVDGESTYLLEGDPVTLKQAAGQRVKVVGTVNDGRISVTSIAAL